MPSKKYLNEVGLAYFWEKIKSNTPKVFVFELYDDNENYNTRLKDVTFSEIVSKIEDGYVCVCIYNGFSFSVTYDNLIHLKNFDYYNNALYITEASINENGIATITSTRKTIHSEERILAALPEEESDEPTSENPNFLYRRYFVDNYGEAYTNETIHGKLYNSFLFPQNGNVVHTTFTTDDNDIIELILYCHKGSNFYFIAPTEEGYYYACQAYQGTGIDSDANAYIDIYYKKYTDVATLSEIEEVCTALGMNSDIITSDDYTKVPLG